MYRNKTWIRRNQKSVARFLAMCLLEPSITMPDHGNLRSSIEICQSLDEPRYPDLDAPKLSLISFPRLSVGANARYVVYDTI